MTFPRLDVDLHLAPFVDARDHLGVAAARVTIGAPHFEREREFWVRPVRSRWSNNNTHILLRPIGGLDNQLLLLPNEISYSADVAHTQPELPVGWRQQGLSVAVPYLKNATFARHWRHPTLPVAARIICSEYAQSRLYPLQNLEVENDAHNYEDPLQLSLEELLDWPSERLHGFVARQFDDKRSQLSLTWEWIQIPRAQRFEEFFNRPEWNGFLDLNKCVLRSEALRNSKIAQWGAGWLFLKNVPWGLACNSQPHQSCDATRINEWALEIRRFYERHINQASVPFLMSLRFHDSQSLTCPAPTHHEMLEARLQLHAWARAHLPPSLAAELIALDALN